MLTAAESSRKQSMRLKREDKEKPEQTEFFLIHIWITAQTGLNGSRTLETHIQASILEHWNTTYINLADEWHRATNHDTSIKFSDTSYN